MREDYFMPKAKPVKPTLITFLLDKSSSMGSIHQDTIDGFNAYLDNLQKDNLPIKFTRIQFDSYGYERDCVAQPLDKVARLDKKNYQPRGSTPLLDAVRDTIEAVAASLEKFDTKHNIIVCIQTDGHENESTRTSWAELKALIEKKTEEGWVFNFMGTGIEAYDQAAAMGVMYSHTLSTGTTRGETMGAYASMSASNKRYAVSGQSVDAGHTHAELRASNSAWTPIMGTQHYQNIPQPQVTTGVQPMSGAQPLSGAGSTLNLTPGLTGGQTLQVDNKPSVPLDLTP
jgi:uncharacterized protein YegL